MIFLGLFWASPGILLLLGGFFAPPIVEAHMDMDTVIVPKEMDPKEMECAHHCLARNISTLFGCYQGCSDTQVKAGEDELFKKNRLLWTHATYGLGLICKDDNSISVRVDIQDSAFPNSVLIQYKVSDGASDLIFLANNPVGLINSLNSGISYNIKGFGLKGNTYDVLEEFTVNETDISTLNCNEPVQEVTDIKALNYRTHPDCKTCLYADIQWTPSPDNICYYRIAWHDTYKGDLHEVPLIVELEPKSHYEITIGELDFEQEYKVAVRSFMHFSDQPKNDFDWRIFVAPQCREIFTKHEEILQMCPPPKPTNIRIREETYLFSVSTRDFIVTWDKPEPPIPHRYTVTIRNIGENISPFSAIVDVTGDKTEAHLEYIRMTGQYYEVTVESFYANGKRTFSNVRERIDVGMFHELLPVFVTLGIFFLFVVILSSTCYIQDLKSRNSYIEERLEMMTGGRSGRDYASDDDLEQPNLPEEEEEDDDEPYLDDSFEVDRDFVTLYEVIGEGHFGTVKKGEFYNICGDNSCIDVAVKMLKNSPSDEEIRKFIQEISIMKSVPKHPNILSVVGHCTEKNEQLLLLTEYCSKGSLLNYLRNEWQTHKSQQTRWSKFTNNFVNYNQTNEEKLQHEKKINTGTVNAVDNPAYSEDELDDFVMVDETHLRMKSLLKIAIQVAEGMKFLALNKVVHRDLAARNVLVNEENVIKIADFGLSRDVYENGMYLKSGGGRVPIKWMALEALSRQLYSTQSDVWSFGVLLYEIITLGCIPYPTVQNDKLLVYLMSGSRMERPPNCSYSLYQLMMSCWVATPSQRPSFDVIAVRLAEEMEKLTEDEFMDLEKLSEDTNLMRDQPRSPSAYLTPIGGRLQYMRLDDSTEDENED